MIEVYLYFIKAHPLLSSAIQVAVLGMLGELIAIRITRGNWFFFWPGPWKFIIKLVIWAFLGITFKYAFAGFFGFTSALVAKGFWPVSADTNIILKAFSVSLFMNLMFGPVMMLFHRITDNLIEHKDMNWSSLQKAWLTLFWFWIPAHIITFCLPSHFQVGLAAVYSLILGIILGYFTKSAKAVSV
jgi:hypothetical protein